MSITVLSVSFVDIYVILINASKNQEKKTKNRKKKGRKEIREERKTTQTKQGGKEWGGLLADDQSLDERCLSDRDDGDDNTVETESRTEDLHDKHLKEKLTFLCITDSSTTARNTYSDTTANIADTSCKTSAKHQETSVVHVEVALL